MSNSTNHMDVIEPLRTVVQDLDYPVENIAFDEENDAVFVGWIGQSEDADKIMSDPRLQGLLAAFSTAMEQGSWPDDIEQMIVWAYDPADAQHKRVNALQTTVSREQARRHERGDIDDTELMLEALEETKLVWKNGRVDDMEVDISVSDDDE